MTPEKARAELERRQRERPHEFWRWKATPDQLAVHKDAHKKRICLGGNRSGKSLTGATECIWWLTASHPFRKTPQPCKVWAVGVDFPTLRDGIKAEYFDKLLPAGDFKYYSSDMIYEITKGAGKGSVLGLKSCDSGRPKFQSVTRDFIWMDEEPDQEIFNECLARVLDCNGEVLLTFTPLEGMTWSYRRLYLNEPGDPEVNIHQLKTEDNPIFGSPQKAREAITRTYSGLTTEELEARMVGAYIPLAGRPVFDRIRLMNLRQTAIMGKRGDLCNIGSIDVPKWEFVAA